MCAGYDTVLPGSLIPRRRSVIHCSRLYTTQLLKRGVITVPECYSKK
jgi:hypothetical protein